MGYGPTTTEMILRSHLVKMLFTVSLIFFSIALFAIRMVGISRFSLLHVKIINGLFFLTYRTSLCEQKEGLLLNNRWGKIAFTGYAPRPVSSVLSPEIAKRLFMMALRAFLCSCSRFKNAVFLRFLLVSLACGLSRTFSAHALKIGIDIIQWIEKLISGRFPLFTLSTLYISLFVTGPGFLPVLYVVSSTRLALGFHPIQIVFMGIEIFSRSREGLLAAGTLLFRGRIRYSIHDRPPTQVYPRLGMLPTSSRHHNIYTSSIPRTSLKSQSVAHPCNKEVQ